MCILIEHNENTDFQLKHLEDFYTKNPDGFGAIVNTSEGVRVLKTVGKLDEIHEMYEQYIRGNQAIIHFRMRTHGDIDIHNCHPYEVTEDLWVAHNGILSTGNAANVAKSDTWHYIENFLKPLLQRDPELIHEPAFQKLLESHVGYQNKLGFMDSSGRIVVINKKAGVTHMNAWLSNTYAWSPHKFGYYQNYQGYQGYGRAYGEDYYEGEWWKRNEKESATTKPSQIVLPFNAEGNGGKQSKKEKGGEDGMGGKMWQDTHVTAPKLSTGQLQRIIRLSYNAMNRHPDYGLFNWMTAQPRMAAHLIHEFFPDSYSYPVALDMVTNDSAMAADVLDLLWTECYEDLMCLGDIQLADDIDYNQVNYGG